VDYLAWSFPVLAGTAKKVLGISADAKKAGIFFLRGNMNFRFEVALFATVSASSCISPHKGLGELRMNRFYF